MCEKHPQQEVSHYCVLHDEVICADCLGAYHSSHYESHTVELNNSTIERELAHIGSKVSTCLKQLMAVQGKIASYQNRQAHLTASEVLQLMKEGAKLQGDKLPIAIREKDPFLKDSLLAHSYWDKIRLQRWLLSTQIEVESTQLLYKASRDGYLSSVFHNFCNNQGPTLTLIRNDQNRVFGGFTTVSWRSDSSFSPDPYSFLFSLTHGT